MPKNSLNIGPSSASPSSHLDPESFKAVSSHLYSDPHSSQRPTSLNIHENKTGKSLGIGRRGRTSSQMGCPKGQSVPGKYHELLGPILGPNIWMPFGNFCGVGFPNLLSRFWKFIKVSFSNNISGHYWFNPNILHYCTKSVMPVTWCIQQQATRLGPHNVRRYEVY